MVRILDTTSISSDVMGASSPVAALADDLTGVYSVAYSLDGGSLISIGWYNGKDSYLLVSAALAMVLRIPLAAGRPQVAFRYPPGLSVSDAWLDGTGRYLLDVQGGFQGARLDLTTGRSQAFPRLPGWGARADYPHFAW